MKVAIPLFGTRVSPRWSYSEKILLVQFEDSCEASRSIVETIGMSEDARISQLADLEVDLFICGAIEEEYVAIAESYGIDVIHNVAGEVDEVVSALKNDQLHSGYGLNGGLIEDAVPALQILKRARPKMDCVECIDRICLKGENCTRAFGEIFPVKNYQQLHHSMEVTADIAAEKHRRLCRVAEFIYYCLEMEYRHLGIAFCVEMYRETEILTRLLRRFFKVSPVCCKVGGRIQPDLVTASNGVICNPIGQARILNRIETDINALVGLCVGCDLIYTQHSKAPTSTLFVKDKSLANNPVSALYSKYYIDEILREL